MLKLTICPQYEVYYSVPGQARKLNGNCTHTQGMGMQAFFPFQATSNESCCEEAFQKRILEPQFTVVCHAQNRLCMKSAVQFSMLYGDLVVTSIENHQKLHFLRSSKY